MAVVFAIALPVSYHVGRSIDQRLQLDKLMHEDREVFEQGLAHVYEHAAGSFDVTKKALSTAKLIESERASEILAIAGRSYSNAETKPPGLLVGTAGSQFARLSPEQAIGLYDSLFQVPGIEASLLSEYLLEEIALPDGPAMLLPVEMLDERFLWSREKVPADKWIAWLSVLAGSDSELTQRTTAKRLGELPDHAEDERVVTTLIALSQSRHDSVRAKVLAAAAGFASIASDPTDYEQLVFELGEDNNPIIARRAWLVVGHLKPQSGYAVKWKDAEPSVAQAILWAAVKTKSDNTKPVFEAYADLTTRRKSLFALGELDSDEAKRRFVEALNPPEVERLEIDQKRLLTHLAVSSGPLPALIDLGCVAVLSGSDLPATRIDQWVRPNSIYVQRLGVLCSAISGRRPSLIVGDFYSIHRENPSLTDVDLHAMSDGELAELGLKRVDAITALLEAAEAAPPSARRGPEAKLLQLALWTRGDLGDDFTPQAEAMLFDEEMPTSTVLMCLLHKQRPISLGYLFDDIAQHKPGYLHELFIQQRWWHVFRRFVDTSDMPLWLWGDSDTQAFQLEAMRQWYAVNRWRIARGWWPEPAQD